LGSGDFNYDGKINIDDYTTVIDSNIGIQAAPFPHDERCRRLLRHGGSRAGVGRAAAGRIGDDAAAREALATVSPPHWMTPLPTRADETNSHAFYGRALEVSAQRVRARRSLLTYVRSRISLALGKMGSTYNPER
jgi:hypothetical protein